MGVEAGPEGWEPGVAPPTKAAPGLLALRTVKQRRAVAPENIVQPDGMLRLSLEHTLPNLFQSVIIFSEQGNIKSQLELLASNCRINSPDTTNPMVLCWYSNILFTLTDNT